MSPNCALVLQSMIPALVHKALQLRNSTQCRGHNIRGLVLSFEYKHYKWESWYMTLTCRCTNVPMYHNLVLCLVLCCGVLWCGVVGGCFACLVALCLLRFVVFWCAVLLLRGLAGFCFVVGCCVVKEQHDTTTNTATTEERSTTQHNKAPHSTAQHRRTRRHTLQRQTTQQHSKTPHNTTLQPTTDNQSKHHKTTQQNATQHHAAPAETTIDSTTQHNTPEQ